jgi:dienelactone hydrolase
MPTAPVQLRHARPAARRHAVHGRALADSRTPCQLAIYPGAPHEFLNLRNPIPAASDARQRMVAFIERVLTDDGQSPEAASL